LLIGFALLISGCNREPSDRLLVSDFHRHYPELEELRKMIDEDDLNGRIHADYSDRQLPLPRLDRYRALMKKTGVTRIWANGRDKDIDMTVWATGMLDVGTYKGYYFSREKQTPVMETLEKSCFDGMKDERQRHCSGFRPLPMAGG
jgi:hypothetical protein